jgi:glycosyltransferase involved in cell wall biosynthesis
LQKTDRDWEAVVVDDASRDHTREVIEEFAARVPRVKYVHETQRGLGAARDTGWRHASGKIVSFTDDDCYLPWDYVDAICDVFLERSVLGFVGGKVLFHDSEDAPVTILLREEPFDIAVRSFVAAGTVRGANLFFRKTTLEKIGGFSREMGAGTAFTCEDIDAIAAAFWVGIPGGYDSRSVVSHHQCRKLWEISKLRRSDDLGRAAYFAKFTVRFDSRASFVEGLRREWRLGSFRNEIKRLGRHLVYGIGSLRQNGRVGSIPAHWTIIAGQFVQRTLSYTAKIRARYLSRPI